ncbi:SWIM zinc finger family protein [Deminuibacter soli]|uniref:SWIM zinc finger family protein n=1 Tax=Deminuibacter soli TaxID=2291815 RepID=A0A3E1NQQ0_9BACT|nr:SWIM zinc finger family protein [Deminuibacter soli]RFM30118.1 SWIM zinc finger family protein [Deminuibacter soli]
MNLSEEQVLGLAPDDAAKKAGKELASPAKWSELGVTPAAIWGLCQGSGSKPYQTQVDTVNLAFKCSCPSRKFPCKHGLGVLLLYARNAALFTATEQPEWVNEWLQKRGEREEKKAVKSGKETGDAAKQKRVQARQQKVSDGVTELMRWIKDLVRGGLAQLPEKGTGFIEGMSKRMIDAQAPGLAAMLRELGEINYYNEHWPSLCVNHLSRLYLLAKSFRHIDQLPPALQQDVRSLTGFPQSQDEIRALPGVQDDWLVLGREYNQEEQLTVERNWLYGTQTGNHALILQFYIGSQLPPLSFAPGSVISAELVYYPSAMPQRALLKQQTGITSKTAVTPMSHWQQVVAVQSVFIAQQPFTAAYPFVVDQLRAVKRNGTWWLQDAQQQLMQLDENSTGVWKMLAISGGKPIQTAVVGKENTYRLLGVWRNDEYKLL